jgi:uncharacterized protein
VSPEELLRRKPQRAVNDLAGVLSGAARNRLEEAATRLHARTGVAVVVVTLPDLGENDIDDYTNRLYEKWGIGSSGRDEGVLLLLAVGDRRIRIETGYGSEGYLPDLRAAELIREATPELARGKWDAGLSRMFVGVVELVAAEHDMSVDQALGGGSAPVRRRPRRSTGLPGTIFTILLVLFLLGTPMGRRMLPWILLFALSSGRSRYSGGGFGGGFGGGGFGGFGGGMSGGGGASGRF